ncbi:MAG: AAA family ATPase [Gammaproteobacteria bacterium]|nr:AAA family ATPase [Gammaproteobacteria bacterium]
MASFPILPGYRIYSKIYESAASQVYRASREKGGQAVILKCLKEDYPDAAGQIRYRQEYEILHSLNSDGVIKAWSLEKHRNILMIVLEDFGGESLLRLLAKQKFSLVKNLELAVRISEIVGEIHAAKVMHKDINPGNLVYNPETNQLKLIDFGLSTQQPVEDSPLRSARALEGTLAYISPEQTGRMNCAVDYRTDFYSLGAAFYELFTGHLPFASTSAMGLVHCHLAKQPLPPEHLNPEIPQTVSGIIMKLMAKNAEARYQNAWGLKADLQTCLMQLRASGAVENFTLGSMDISDQFQPVQKLYGRKWEIGMLLGAFDRVSRLGHGEMLLVTGYSGAGKTTLIQEIYKPVSFRRGYFVSGKFEQLQRNIPYFAIINALQDLLRQLLTESKNKLVRWKEKLRNTLGANAQVIIEMLPELERIIGPQAALPALDAIETQNRFKLCFQGFMRALCSENHPLVIFLDDLQWADAASLNLIALMMERSYHLFFIGAYRDNEVDASHPLLLRLAEIKKSGVPMHTLPLPPLEAKYMGRFVSDSFHISEAKAAPLAELVWEKTRGNPFFMREFLKILYDEKLLRFTPPAEGNPGGWQWDLAQIRARDITSNVIELLAAKVQNLSAKTRQVLQLAACIGNRFDLHTLAAVYEKTPAETAEDLQESIAGGQLSIIGEPASEQLANEYRFVHDRIQQAVYSLIPEQHRQAVHVQIGHLLLQNIPEEEREQKIFAITDQLNAGAVQPEHQAERDELAELNLAAGRKAKASAAYVPAYNYFQRGLKLLEKESWQRRYRLTLALTSETVETAYLSGDYDNMEHLADSVLQSAQTVQDKVKVHEALINAYIARNKHSAAIDAALSILRLLGVRLPRHAGRLRVASGFLKLKLVLAGKRDLALLPKMTDTDKQAAMRILSCVAPAVYVSAPALMPLLVFKQVRLSAKYGNAPESAFAYANYGMVLCGIAGNIEAGYRFGQLAIELAMNFRAGTFRAGALFVVNRFIKPWKKPVRDTLPALLDAYRSGLENGDIEFAAYAVNSYCIQSYYSGKELVKLKKHIVLHTGAIQQLKQELALLTNKMYWQVVLNLTGTDENPFHLRGEIYDEEKMLPLHRQTGSRPAIFHLYLNKLILCYLFHRYADAFEYTEKAKEYLDGGMATLAVPLFHFYDSLIRLALFPETGKAKQKKFLKQIAASQKKMRKWARYAPVNYKHKLYLVEAERARVSADYKEAREYYDQAIALARANRYIQEEALACELAGRFYLTRGQVRLALHYLGEARHAYRRWGAVAKVRDLEERYTDYVRETKENKQDALAIGITASVNTDRDLSDALDLASVLKASQAIAGEIELKHVLEKLIDIVVENAGAQRGALVFEHGEHWTIEEGAFGKDDTPKLRFVPLAVAENAVPTTLINYAARTRESVVLQDAAREDNVPSDPYIIQRQPRSVACIPLGKHGKLTGILYLENNLAAGVFTPARLKVIDLLSSQMVISIENAKLYNSLSESEERFRIIAETSPTPILISRKSNDLILYANAQAGKTLDLPAEELVRKRRTVDFYHNPADHGKLLETFVQNQRLRDHELLWKKADGTPIWILIFLEPITFYEEQAIFGTFVDITQRKHAEKERLNLTRQLEVINKQLKHYAHNLEEEVAKRTEKIEAQKKELEQTLEQLQAAQQQLVESEKMAALGNLVAGVAHEINTPVGVAVTASSHLDTLTEKIDRLYQARNMKRTDLEKYLKSAKRGNELVLANLARAADLVKSFKQVATDQSSEQLRVFMLKQYLHEILTSLQPKFKRTRHQVTILCDEKIEINSYPGVYYQIITNLLMNSLIHGFQGRPEGLITIEATKEEQRLLLRYSDNGKGISADTIKNIFDPFFTTNRQGGGTGLGLHIVYNLVTHKLNGTIRCDSTVGEGVVFNMEIPN